MQQNTNDPNDINTWCETSTGDLVAEGDLPPAVRAFAQRVSAAYDDVPAGRNSDVVQLTPEERAWEIAQNVASIEAVPLSVWESSCADPASGSVRREWALHWARRGYDVYAYKGFGEHGIWNLWLETQRIELGREGSAE